MSILPTEFFSMPTSDIVATDFPTDGYKTTYRFVDDFTTDDDPPHNDVIEGTDALEQLATKSLQTRRYAYLVYGPEFGSDLGAYMDTDPLASSGRSAMLESLALDCLQGIRLVRSVEELSVEVLDEGTHELEVSGTLVDAFGARSAFSVSFVP